MEDTLVKDTILTQDIKGQAFKELLLNRMLTPNNIVVVDFTLSVETFMLNKPEPISKKMFSIFSLGKIFGNLGRKDLYEDR